MHWHRSRTASVTLHEQISGFHSLCGIFRPSQAMIIADDSSGRNPVSTWTLQVTCKRPQRARTGLACDLMCGRGLLCQRQPSLRFWPLTRVVVSPPSFAQQCTWSEQRFSDVAQLRTCSWRKFCLLLSAGGVLTGEAAGVAGASSGCVAGHGCTCEAIVSGREEEWEEEVGCGTESSTSRVAWY